MAPEREVAGASLSVVLPAYKEAENLRLLLPRLAEVVRSLSARGEIIVVDTMEPMDDTEAVCAEAGVTHLRRARTDEYGNAIRTGIRNSTGDFVVIMDADGSHDPGFLAKLWERRGDADVVIASRYATDGSTENPFLLVFMSRLLNLFFARVLEIPVRDVSNSLRIYRGDLIRRIETTALHFDIHEEILGRLLWATLPAPVILEIPFTFRRRMSGRSKRSLLVFVVSFLKMGVRLRRLRRDSLGSAATDRAA